MRIGDLAAAAGVAPSLVRYYEARGVIPPPARISGARVYEPGAVDRLRRALVARGLGLSLADVKAALTGEGSWSGVAAERIAAGDAEIRELRIKRALLRCLAGAELRERALQEGLFARMLGVLQRAFVGGARTGRIA